MPFQLVCSILYIKLRTAKCFDNNEKIQCTKTFQNVTNYVITKRKQLINKMDLKYSSQ